MTQQRSPYITWLVGLFLVFYFVISILSVQDKVSVYDEHPHILSGYSYLQTGKFSGGLDNPPLLQTLFVLPAWLYGVKYRPYVDENLVWYRIPAIVIGTLAGLLIFLWSKSLYGEKAGLFSLFLYIFSTGCLGLARYAVLDFGAAFFFLLALFFADFVLQKQSPFRIIIAGIVCGLALCTKYTLLPLIALVPLLALLTPEDSDEEGWWHNWVNGLSWPFLRQRLMLIVPFLVITFLVVNACFLFEGFLTQKTLEPHLQMELAQEQLSTLGMLGRFVPTSFHSGLAGKLKQAKRGREAFLWGSRWKGGTIVYYLACLYLKTTLIFQLLTLLLIGLLASKSLSWGLREARIWLPVGLLFGYLSVFSRVNIGLRHAIFVLPALHILMGGLFRWFESLSPRKSHWIGFSLVLFLYALSGFSVYPHFIEFFTSTVGGPSEGYHYLIDSNLDWGQNDHLPKRFKKERKLLSLKVFPPPYQAETGWFALSVNAYQGLYFADTGPKKRSPWSWLKRFKPVARLANTWFIYQVTEQDYETYLKENPKDVWAWLDIGFIRMRRRNVQGSFDALKKADALAPIGRAETQFRLGQLALSQGDPDEAIKRLELSLNLEPRNEKIRSYLEIAKAEAELRRLATQGKKSPKEDEFVAAEIYKLARAYGMLGEFTAADSYLNRLRRAGLKDAAYLWFHSAYLKYYLGKFQTAARYMAEAHRLDNKSKEIKDGLELMEHLATLIRAKDARMLHRAGLELEEVGQHKMAMVTYLKAHELEPSAPTPLWALGGLQISRRLGRHPFTWP